MKRKSPSNRLLSLQALRGIAILTVFVDHAHLVNKLGSWGVVIFFIMSGFLMTLNYMEQGRINKISILSNIQFAFSRFRKLLPLHIVTMLSLALLELLGSYHTPIPEILMKIFMNTTLQFDWFPDFGNFLINPSAWFISALWFSYFIFPWLLKYMEKHSDCNSAIYSIIILSLLQITLSLIILHIPEGGAAENFIFNHREYLIYMFPPMTLIEFMIGAWFGIIYLSNFNIPKNKTTASILETIVVIINLLLIPYMLKEKCNVFWLTLPCACLVYLFALQKGCISGFLTNKLLIFFGDYSMEIFLIHYPISRYLEAAVAIVLGRDIVNKGMTIFNITIGLLLTLLCSYIWKQISKQLKMHLKSN